MWHFMNGLYGYFNKLIIEDYFISDVEFIIDLTNFNNYFKSLYNKSYHFNLIKP